MEFDFDHTNFDNLGESWERYEGNFKEDTKDGLGRLFLVDGSMLDGTFEGDQVHGHGVYVHANGERVAGLWKNNKLVETE